MAYPIDPAPDPLVWFKNQFITAAVIQANITDLFNALRSLPLGILGAVDTGSTVTLSTTSRFAAGASVTFTVPAGATWRIKISVSGQAVPASATSGRYLFQAGYNTGTSPAVGSFVGVGQAIAVITDNSRAGGGAEGTPAYGTALLGAGTYTAYCGVTRISGGNAADTTNTPSVLVEQIGVV